MNRSSYSEILSVFLIIVMAITILPSASVQAETSQPESSTQQESPEPSIQSTDPLASSTVLKFNYSKIVVAKGKNNKRLKATVYPVLAAGETVIWKSENKKIAKINKSTGVITGVKNGTTRVYASTQNSETVFCKVIVGGISVEKVKLNHKKATIQTKKTIKLKATLNPSKPTVKGVNWASSDPSIATVSKKGTVTSLKPGKVTITALSKDCSGKKASCIIIVRQAVESISLNNTSVTILTGKSFPLIVKEVLPASASKKSIKWKSSDSKTAKISSTGVITGKKPGKVTITATAKDGSGVKARCTVTVIQAVGKITLNTNIRTIPIDKTYTLKITGISPSNAYNKQTSWGSSNPGVATVSNNGIVTALSQGKTTIKAMSQDGSGVAGSCDIYVGDQVNNIVLNTTEMEFNKPGMTYKLVATAYPATAMYKGITWTSSNKSIASVSSDGVIKPLKPGTVTITATAADGSGVVKACTVKNSFTKGDARVYMNTQKIYKKTGTGLHKNYMWVVNHLSYKRRNGHPKPPKGFTREQMYAVEGMEKRTGNCFTYAATFTQLAKGLGYDAKFIVGQIHGRNGGYVPHGFVIIKIKGSRYICDPELESVGSKNLYMQPISNPKASYKW